jgi:hypothetical protein
MHQLYAHPPTEGESTVDIHLTWSGAGDHKGPDGEKLFEFAGRVSTLRIGRAYAAVVSGAQLSEMGVSVDPRALPHDEEIVNIRFACSFLPDRRCRFVWARLGVKLRSVGPSGRRAPATIIDMFPREVGSPISVNRSYTVKASLKLAFVEAALDGGIANDGIAYSPSIYASGLLSDSATWTFQAARPPWLSGVRELFLLVRLPKGSGLELNYSASAEVRTSFGVIPLRHASGTGADNRWYRTVLDIGA